MDLPALRSMLADVTNGLDGFDGLTHHHNPARRSLDQADQAVAALRTDLRSKAEALHQLSALPATAENAA